jgi:6-phosphogluconolactonase
VNLDSLQPVVDVPAAFTATVGEGFERRPGPRFTLVLSGGPTAQACYERLAEASVVDWSVTTIYMGDERMVPPDDPDANQLLVRQALVDRVTPTPTFRPMPTDGTAEACAKAYQQVIADALATDGLDLVHLGMGPDGHTASLFPGSPELEVGPDVLVVASTDPNGRNPHPRLSLTLPAINQARMAVFTVAGESKQEAVAKLRAAEDIPAARVAATDVRWIIDIVAYGHQEVPAP